MNPKLEELAGNELKGFRILKLTEVYLTDDDGRYAKSLGFFKKEGLAKAFAASQTDASWHKTDKRFVLTDGKVGFLIDGNKPVKLFDDEEEAVKIKEKALAKLSPEERKLLGH